MPGPDGDPIADLKELGDSVRRWFPGAFVAGGEPLPAAPRFWHMVAGLAMLADWMGSDRSIFHFANGNALDRMLFARDAGQQALKDFRTDQSEIRITDPTFDRVSPYPPREIQTATGTIAGNVVVMESETGSGKTEAAIYRWAQLFARGEVDGLYFALPTRVAATSLHTRVVEAVSRMYGDRPKPVVVLAVPGYLKADETSGRALPGFEVLWDDDPSDATRRSRWAAEAPKRYLAGCIVVGTIDQILLGAITSKHSHMRTACSLRHLLVVDEVHASDTYMESLLSHLLSLHTAAGGHSLLLSATLGSAARSRLLGSTTPALAVAERMDYPAISTDIAPMPVRQAGSEMVKSVALALNDRIGDPDAIAEMALDAARQGAKVLVIRNLQKDALSTARALFAKPDVEPFLFRCAGVAALHHGRYAREDRTLLDAAVMAAVGAIGQMGDFILIGTQTLEQSLDIDADLIITDLCPADVLLQRLGRLHRHRRERPAGFKTPRAVILAPSDLSTLLTRFGGHGLGGTRNPYQSLLTAEATRRLIASEPRWHIPAMNRLSSTPRTPRPSKLSLPNSRGTIAAGVRTACAQPANLTATFRRRCAHVSDGTFRGCTRT